MKIIATIPPLINENCYSVAKNRIVSEARFNTGSHGKSSYSPFENLQQLQRLMDGKKLYVDLKGRQLRVNRWSSPLYGAIVLNRKIEVDLPAQLWLRGEKYPLVIADVNGNKVFTQTNPQFATGAGQAANVIGSNLKIKGKYLTLLDEEYIMASRKLGIHDYMLSYVECSQDIEVVYDRDPKAKIHIKIESLPGLNFIQSQDFAEYKSTVSIVAARDDLFLEMKKNRTIIGALKSIIDIDPEAIVASRLLESLVYSESVSLSDLEDLYLMRYFGYDNFMLSDGLCADKVVFGRIMDFFETYLTD